MTDYVLRQGETTPALHATLRREDGGVVDLSDAVVYLHLRNADTGEQRLFGDAAVENAESGAVRYDWAPEDTDTVGVFDALWEVAYADGRTVLCAEPDPPTLEVVDDLT